MGGGLGRWTSSWPVSDKVLLSVNVKRSLFLKDQCSIEAPTGAEAQLWVGRRAVDCGLPVVPIALKRLSTLLKIQVI